MPASDRTRRRFLQLLAGAAAAAPLAQRVGAQAPPLARSGELPFTPLTESLLAAPTGGGNCVVLTGPSGLLFVNGGIVRTVVSPRDATQPDVSLGFGAGAPRRIEYLFNTDWHPENTGFNLTVAQDGGQILAHEFTKQYLAIDRYVDWQNAKHKALPAKALPTKTFVKPGSMTFGGETIDYAPLGQAHTDGDIYVFFRKANVLAVGDVMTVGTYPIADYTSGGWLGGLQTATKTLLDLANAETRIVPGIGPVQTRADLQAQYDMLSASRDAFVKMMRQGMSADEMLASGVMKKFDARWGDPQLFVRTSYRGLWLHVRELGGIV
jgi:glyoxylase-like metal-dependent hydrolase (beta-lactamase superfamily II)